MNQMRCLHLRRLLTAMMLIATVTLQSQSYDHPFVRTQSLKIKIDDATTIPNLGILDISEVIAYTDALNRTTQVVSRMASPNYKDVVKFSSYDLDNSHVTTYMGYTTQSADGSYRPNPVAEQSNFFQNALKVAHTAYPYSQVWFDGSPLQRITQASSPGYNWRYLPTGDGNTVKTSVLVNQSGEVRLWTINGDNTVSTAAFYQGNTLSGLEVMDENRQMSAGGKRVIKFSDMSGKTILKKEVLSDAKSLLTYYVYDDFGNLRFIIPPKAVANIPSAGNWNSASCQASDNDLVFWNQYDKKHRLIIKKVPGKAVEYFAYDKLDRVIMRQDGNLRGNNQWYFYKYDILGRVIQEGIVTDNHPLADLQVGIDGSVAPSFEERCSVTQALPNGYTDQSYPLTGQTSSPILKLFYYDQYPSFVTSASPYSFKPQSGFYQTDETVFDRLQGAVTTIKTRILESGEHWLVSVNYYDIHSRVIQAVSDNHLGGIDVICNSYNFDGSLQKTKIIHNYNAQNLPTESIQYRYNYDRMGRVLNIYQKYCESCDEITYASYKYNELGQLIDKNLHMPFNGKGYLQSIDYAYNPKGWLTRINQANLTNSNIYIQNEITCAQEEKIYGMRIDSIAISVKVSTDKDGVNYLNLTFNDKKNLSINRIEYPDSSRCLDASESASVSFSEDCAEQQQVYDVLIPYKNNTYHFALNNITFDENSETQMLLDSIAVMINGQLTVIGVTDSSARETLSAMVKTFFSDKVGIVFFNEDKNDLFGMEIHYDDGLNLQYNGNIASIIWQHRTNDPGQRRYTYRYDRCNRLRSADYAVLESGSWGNNSQYGRYNINGADNGGIGYDDNGNILSLNRFGEQDIHDPQIGTPDYGQIDQLDYTSYKGNQLDALTDQYSDSTAAGMPDFHDLSTATSGEYQYDANGNMVRDDNKGITAIVYNHMNLPVEINFGANNKIVYLYDANGRKLMKQVIYNAQSHHTDYAGGFIYEDDLLKMILTPEGRIIKNSTTTYDPQYFIKDYLGNTRVVFHANATTGSVEVLQEDQFDPFGMKLGGLGMISDAENKYLYQGKELNNDAIDLNNDGDPDTYLNWYDFEARNYDPQIGRWHVADPVAQYPSPYIGMGNNPVSLIDPDGLATVWSSEDETTLWYTRVNDDHIYSRRVPMSDNAEITNNSSDQLIMQMREAIGISGGSLFGDWKAEKIAMFYYTQEQLRLDAAIKDAEKNKSEPSPVHDMDLEMIADVFADLNSQFMDAATTGLSFGGPQGKGGSWVSSVDWAGVFNASLNLLGGVGEIIIGGAGEYFSGGTATPACVPLIVDGGYRTATNFSRLVGYLTLNDGFANAMPGNIGATIGKGIDMLSGVPIDGYGYGQGIGGATNDFVSFIATGGTAGSMSNMVSNPSLMNGVWYMSAFGGYTNSLFYDFYPLKK